MRSGHQMDMGQKQRFPVGLTRKTLMLPHGEELTKLL